MYILYTYIHTHVHAVYTQLILFLGTFPIHKRWADSKPNFEYFGLIQYDTTITTLRIRRQSKQTV